MIWVIPIEEITGVPTVVTGVIMIIPVHVGDRYSARIVKEPFEVQPVLSIINTSKLIGRNMFVNQCINLQNVKVRSLVKRRIMFVPVKESENSVRQF